MAQRKKILLVDDELSIALVLKGVITDQGYNVEVAHSGEEALEALKKSDADLLITDIKMPGMDGFELIRTLQMDPKHKNLKYVILTAFNDREAIAKAKKDFGIDYYIVKPFDLADVEAAVAEIMQKISS